MIIISIKEIETESKKVTKDLYRKAFEMGVSLHYEDDRTKGSDYYIQANPDGLEDLVDIPVKLTTLFRRNANTLLHVNAHYPIEEITCSIIVLVLFTAHYKVK